MATSAAQQLWKAVFLTLAGLSLLLAGWLLFEGCYAFLRTASWPSRSVLELAVDAGLVGPQSVAKLYENWTGIFRILNWIPDFLGMAILSAILGYAAVADEWRD